MGVIRSGRGPPAPPAQEMEGVGYRFGDTQHPPSPRSVCWLVCFFRYLHSRLSPGCYCS